MENEQILTIKIDYKEPLSVTKLQKFLEAWNNQFEKQCKINKESDILLVKEIRKGSLLIDLIASVTPILTDFNTIYSLVNNSILIIDWLKSKKGVKPDMSLDDLKDFKNIVAPANQNGNQIIITGTNYGSINIGYDEARIIDKNADEEIASLQKSEETDSRVHNEILTLKQIKDDDNDDKNTKGIIEEISEKTYPIVFSEKTKKEELIHSKDNPFNKSYLVNIKVNKRNDKIVSYTVLDIIDSYYIEEKSLEANPDSNPDLFNP